jgi:hypothetical protein
MKTHIDFFVSLVTSLVLLLGGNAAYANVAGHVQFVNGVVQLTDPAGQTHGLKKGEAINEGDTLTSAKGASAQIRMQDGGFVAVRADTQLKFDSFKFSGKQDGTEQSFFSLLKGGFRAVTGLIGQLNKSSYQITTPVATIGIRGTDHETFLVAPGSELAAVAPPGAYNKVNIGETYLATDKGTVFVLPNQMGFAGAKDQMPQLQPINTNLFTVAAEPAPQAKGDKEEGKEEGVRETAVVDNTAQEQVAPAPAPVAPENTVAPNIIQIPVETTGGTNLTGGTLPAPTSTTVADGVNPNTTNLNWMTSDFNPSANSHFLEVQPAPTFVVYDAQGLAQTYVNSTTTAGLLLGRTTAGNYEGGSDAGVISWGRWANGQQMFGSWSLQTYTLDQGNHMIVALPVVTYPQLNAVAYNFFAATRPTEATNVATGNVWQATGGTLTANFLNNNLSANLNLTLNGNSTYLMNVSGTAMSNFNTASGTTTFQGGTQNVCSTGCSANARVTFAGSNATHAGMVYDFLQTNEVPVTGAAIYKR